MCARCAPAVSRSVDVRYTQPTCIVGCARDDRPPARAGTANVATRSTIAAMLFLSATAQSNVLKGCPQKGIAKQKKMTQKRSKGQGLHICQSGTGSEAVIRSAAEPLRLIVSRLINDPYYFSVSFCAVQRCGRARKTLLCEFQFVFL